MKTVIMNVTRPISPTESHAAGATVTIADDLADYYIGTGAARYATLQQRDARLRRRASDGGADAVVAPGGELAGLNVTTDASGNTVLKGADGLKTRFSGPRNAMRTVVCGNSIAAQSKHTGTYIPTKSLIHWANLFGGSPLRFTRITASTRADVHGVYAYSGQTLGTINADLPAQFIDPVNTAGWLPECVIGCGLLENDIVAGQTVAQMQKSFNNWRRLMQAIWPGVLIVTHTPLPSFSYNTAAMVLAYQQMREWMLSLDDGVSLLVSDFNAYENPAAPGTPLSGYTDASTHPTATGASVLGRRLAATIGRIGNAWQQPHLIRYNNPALSGTGAASGTNVTGTVATGFAISGSANGAFVATAEQPGQLIAITGNSGAGPALTDISTCNAGSITTADTRISPFVEIEIVSGAENIHQIGLEPRVNDGGGNNFRYFMQHQTNDARPDYQNGDVLTIISPPMVATAVQSVRALISCATTRFLLVVRSASGCVSKA